MKGVALEEGIASFFDLLAHPVYVCVNWPYIVCVCVQCAHAPAPRASIAMVSSFVCNRRRLQGIEVFAPGPRKEKEERRKGELIRTLGPTT